MPYILRICRPNFYLKNMNTFSKKPTVTIGIPAYNEEANIKHLLISILGQKQDNFELLEIIVVSDCSNDGTVKEASSINDPRISIVDDGQRKGKTGRQNELLDKFRGDILVILDADILPKDDNFFKNLIAPISKDKKVGMTSCIRIPIEGGNFFEKIINFSVALKNDIFTNLPVNNMYTCAGAARAFSRKFANKLKWPSTVAEDVFSFLLCKNSGFSFIEVTNTNIVYRSPNNFNDHLRQSARFKQSQKVMYQYFPKELVDKNYKISTRIIIKSCVRFFFKNPLFFMVYTLIYCMTLVASKFIDKTSAKWDLSISSKKLI